MRFEKSSEQVKRLELLDYGRFLALINVVIYHYFFNGISNGKITSVSYSNCISHISRYGYIGVSFFFMISGYVIFISAKRYNATQFTTSRIIRLYPCFWFAVIFTSIFSAFWGGPIMSVTPMQVLANLTMVPSLFGYNFVDGVYWALVFELKFYFIVLILLLSGLQKKLEPIFILWPLLMLLALIANKNHLPYLGGHYYFFAAGSLFAILKKKPSKITMGSLLITFILCINFHISKTDTMMLIKNADFSKIVIGFYIICLFLFFLYLNTRNGTGVKLYKSKELSSLTYPVYLIHANLGFMFINRFANDGNKYYIYIATLIFVFVTAYIMQKVMDIQFVNFCKSLLAWVRHKNKVQIL